MTLKGICECCQIIISYQTYLEDTKRDSDEQYHFTEDGTKCNAPFQISWFLTVEQIEKLDNEAPHKSEEYDEFKNFQWDDERFNIPKLLKERPDLVFKILSEGDKR